MKKLKVTACIIGLTTVLLLAGFESNAQRGRGYRQDGERAARSYRMFEILDLTDEQQTEIEKLHLNFQKENLSARNKIREKNAQLNTLITEGASQSKINPLIEEIGDLRTEIQKSRMNTHLTIRELLTDEQKIRFDTRFANRPGLNHRHFGWHGRGFN